METLHPNLLTTVVSNDVRRMRAAATTMVALASDKSSSFNPGAGMAHVRQKFFDLPS